MSMWQGPSSKTVKSSQSAEGFLKKDTGKEKTTGDKDRKGSLGSASPKLLKTTRGENEEEGKNQQTWGMPLG